MRYGDKTIKPFTKMRTPRRSLQIHTGYVTFPLKKPALDYYQYNNNTIRLCATQYKNANTAFHRSPVVFGGLALFQAFC